MATKNYTVEGMTCGHCKASVEIAGVTGVEVDLATGNVAVTGEFTDEQVTAAVGEAGYAVK